MALFKIKPWYKKGTGYKVMTVILDLNNPDPTTWATYADDAVGMSPGSDAWDDFFGHYPCILDNGVELGKLKRNNFNQYEDGTSIPTADGKDVMICFPRRGIKLERVNDLLYVSMTDGDNVQGYSYLAHTYKGNRCSDFYLGAYKGYVSSSKLYSKYNVSPTGSQTIGTFRTYARNRGTGYEQSGFFQLTYRQIMYLLKYKGQNAQSVIGRGYVDASAVDITGRTYDKGMDYGTSSGTEHMKLFGLEDFYGNIHEFIDGIRSDANRQIYVSDGDFNDTGSDYISAGTPSFSSDINGYLRYPNGTNLAGFVGASQTYGRSSAYFCDFVYVTKSRLVYFGGRFTEGTNGGVFRIAFSATASFTLAYVGARLMFFKRAA